MNASNLKSSDNKRSPLIQVLCILTFIGSLIYAFGIFTVEGSEEFSTWFQITILVLNIITGVAAWMMWNSNKFGFYLYAFAELTAFLIPLIIALAARPALQAYFAMSFISIIAVMSVTMVILYWVATRKW